MYWANLYFLANDLSDHSVYFASNTCVQLRSYNKVGTSSQIFYNDLLRLFINLLTMKLSTPTTFSELELWKVNAKMQTAQTYVDHQQQLLIVDTNHLIGWKWRQVLMIYGILPTTIVPAIPWNCNCPTFFNMHTSLAFFMFPSKIKTFLHPGVSHWWSEWK